MKGVKISGRPLSTWTCKPRHQWTPESCPPGRHASLLSLPLRQPTLPDPPLGWESDQAVESARAHVAALINASPKEIIFTSGATESNNISVKGVLHFFRDKKRHVVTNRTEHKCALDFCRHLQQEGFDFEVTYLPIAPDGLIDLDKLQAAIRLDTGLVSVMMVNNEIGVIQPVEEIGKICKEFNVPFHTDTALALGKISILV